MGALALALAGAASLACASSRQSAGAAARAPRDSLLLVTFDTLRADHVGCYGYSPGKERVSPHIDALAQEGMRFTRCFAPRGETAPSLCSLMTGCYPAHHGVMENQQKFTPGMRTLAEYLNEAGYVTGAFVGVVPGSVEGKAFRGFTEVIEARRINNKEGDQFVWDGIAEAGLMRFLAARKDDPRPFCAWVHFYDVHFPYAPPAPYDTLYTGDYTGPMHWSAGTSAAEYDKAITHPLDDAMVRRSPLERADARYVTALYDGGIRSTDERVGRILARLDELGLRGRTVVLFSADHGEDLGEHNLHWFHASSVYESVLHIPLIVRGPGIRVATSNRIVQNVDVLPTLLEHAGLAPTSEVDGLSFADALWKGAAPRAARDVAWSEWQDLILGARTERWKLIFNPRGAQPKKPPYFGRKDDPGYHVDCLELYDLLADPHETRNVYDEHRDEVAELKELVADEYARRFTGKNVAVAAESDEAERKAMEQLGYAAGGEQRDDVVFNPDLCRDRK